jgi:hypothetical protein
MLKPGAYARLRRQLQLTDPLIVAAADEIDQTLIDAALDLSPWERVRACSETQRLVSGFQRGGSAVSG